MPRLRVEFGHDSTDIEVPDGCLMKGRRGPATPAIVDVSTAVRAALETPVEFPPLRRALTPDDHVAVVLAEDVNRLPDLLSPVLEHLLAAGLDLRNVSVVCSPSEHDPGTHDWRGSLPEAFRSVAVEEHVPAERNKLSYLATTKAGRRIYLNRTLVDADQLVVISRIGYDPVLGYAGGTGGIFPEMSDETTRAESAQKVSQTPPGDKPRSVLQEADEVGWLLGMPFVLQVIEGKGDEISHVLGGAHGPVARLGHELLDQHWRVTVQRSAALVVATLTGDPARHTFAAVTRAFAAAARVVQPGGRIVVLSRAGGTLGSGPALMRQAENPAAALALARQHKHADSVSAWELATAAQFAQLYLLSNWPREVVEDLFMVPLDHAGQLQNLVNGADSCLYLPDAHKLLALVHA